MSDISFSTMLHRHIRRWNGSKLEWDLSSYHSRLAAIRSEENRCKDLSPDELQTLFQSIRNNVHSGKEPERYLASAYGIIAAAVRSLFRITPFDEQLIAGIVLHEGKCAQMQTGEGKTLAAVFPAAFNALAGRGVHVLTFNDYLAQRDAEWMGPVYDLLGLSVGYITQEMSSSTRRKAYQCDITYLSAKEAGFDYLRDNCVYDMNNKVQRALHYAIIDEADSVLIDEARIPLVIAASESISDEDPIRFSEIVRRMNPEQHFCSDSYGRKLHLTDEGIDFIETTLRCGNIYSPEYAPVLSGVHHALHAHHLLHRNVDYLVRNNSIELIDELTGRVADRRRWPDGLHAAVEAKEGCTVQSRSAVRASITIHHFIALYEKRSGMTATAESAEEELHDWYNLATVVIPPHNPCIRKDLPDVLFATREEKLNALYNEIIKVHSTGQPILIGTRTVAESEEVALRIRAAGIDCRVLNARDISNEAQIIAEAGAPGAVTISTNMAGRGTDIKLGGSQEKEYDAVAYAGGLYVIGTNRFESRRIDDQLRGRAGRQGNPGMSRFFISLEDDLFVRYRINELLPPRFKPEPENGPISDSGVTAEVNRLQRIIEGQHSDIKMTLGKYSAIIETQRKILSTQRNKILQVRSLSELLPEEFLATLQMEPALISTNKFLHYYKHLYLSSIDQTWSSFLADISDIREGIHLRRFGNQDPLFEFNRLAIDRFATVIDEAYSKASGHLSILTPETTRQILNDGTRNKNPSAIWTYMVSDNPFEDRPDIALGSNMGYSVFAGLLWPVTSLMLLLKKKRTPMI